MTIETTFNKEQVVFHDNGGGVTPELMRRFWSQGRHESASSLYETLGLNRGQPRNCLGSESRQIRGRFGSGFRRARVLYHDALVGPPHV